MDSSFFRDNFNFVNYSNEHLYTIIVSVLLSIWILYFAKKKLSDRQQKLLGFYLAIFVLLTQLAKVVIKMQLGVFDKSTDLPLHLCNMMPFLVPFAMLMKNRTIWAILFFWIMGGTFQSLFSPTLKQSFPHYEFWRYWIVHCGLVMLMLYGAIVLNFRLKIKDAIISAVLLNIVALIIYNVDLALDANYLYLRAKPEGTTLYTFLGDWPVYILHLEFILVILFTIIYLPFHFINKLETKKANV
ncbi:MAG: TIGR02206 family membrane protein [Saprospiraceae bacterium]|nr:TIGR02206 family membrane protein [Bacteroidia bacterium]NNF21362.1 TIGR02206 family membrane protein [Saprospiraceae bacterium]